VQPHRVVPTFDEAEAGHLGTILDVNLRRSSSSHSGVAKKLSHMALS
jgi:hypothetical protein